MDIVLWIVQGLLAVLFLLTGGMKVVKSKDELKASGGGRMDWVDDLSQGQVRTIGILEVLAAIGLILPSITGILPILTPLAAAGLVMTMIGAISLHFRRGDPKPALVMNGVLMLMAVFVVYGRFIAVSIIA